MRRELVIAGIVGTLASAGVSARGGQITSYVDARGRLVYINADEPRKKVAPKAKRNSRHSVLVRRDRRTGQLIPIPPPPDPAEAARPAPPAVEQSRATAEQPATKQPVEAQSQEKENAPADSVPARNFSIWSSLDQMIADTAERHALDPDLVRAIVKVESNFNPNAISYKGAMGLMQLIPGTARRFGVGNIFDPEQNLDGGARYLKHLLWLYAGNLHLSLAAYNAGEKAVERHGGIPPYAETRQYVSKISSLYRSGYILNPFTLSAQAQTRPDRWGIMKRVDEKGRVHFSNTEGW